MNNINNSYILAGVIILIAIIGFVIAGKKTEAPTIVKDKISTEKVLTDGVYNLILESSSLTWKGEYLTGLSENGTVNFRDGTVIVSDGTIISGEFTLDMNTIESNPRIDLLVNHLKSDDFFGVETYPIAKFVLKKMIPATADGAKIGRYVIAGDLTVRGITKPISLMATITENENYLEAKASFAINRAEWEIKYNSPSFFNNLGDKVIRDAVEIGLDLKADKVIQ